MKKVLADALAKRGYTDLTPVQKAVTAEELQDCDLLVSAQTGSGKTVGFGLALGQTLLADADRFDRADKPLAMIIAPTRELALQVKRELAWLYAEAGAVLASCVGGMDMRDERRALDRGAHIVVATPGRLRDHIMRGSINLTELRAVVMDEADEMLDLGFREDLEFILDATPQSRRTLMFSATVPVAIAKLAKSYQKDAVRVTTLAEKSQHSDIEYQALAVAPRDAENAIINVLRFHESPNALVFANTRAMVNRITTRLSNRGFSVVSLSGELSQNERTHALQAMRDGRARICVATDVAARGIDLPNLDLVVHAELPTNHETLLHRSGRTGRAGRKGVSVLIVPPAARKKAERILNFAKLKAKWGVAPSADEVNARDEVRMLEDPVWSEPVSEGEAETVDKLVARYDTRQIAAAYLRLYRTRQSAPEELSDPGDTTPKPRAPFGPSAWFTVTGGRAAGAEPRRLLPMICKAGGLSKDDIGAIRIRDDISYVEIKKGRVEEFLKALDGRMEIEAGAILAPSEKGPDQDAPRAGKSAHRPAHKPAHKSAPRPQKPDAKNAPTSEPVRKPRAPKPDPVETGALKPYAGRPRTEKPTNNKARYEKPREDKPKFDKPKRDSGKSSKSAPVKPKPAAAPIDWNDSSVSRRKKTSGRPDLADGPKGKPKTFGKKPINKGAPAAGKPTSKKNKARAVAAKGGSSAKKKPR